MAAIAPRTAQLPPPLGRPSVVRRTVEIATFLARPTPVSLPPPFPATGITPPHRTTASSVGGKATPAGANSADPYLATSSSPGTQVETVAVTSLRVRTGTTRSTWCHPRDETCAGRATGMGTTRRRGPASSRRRVATAASALEVSSSVVSTFPLLPFPVVRGTQLALRAGDRIPPHARLFAQAPFPTKLDVLHAQDGRQPKAPFAEETAHAVAHEAAACAART